MRALLALVLVLIAGTAKAQAIRAVYTDAMTDRKALFVQIPSTDGRAVLVLGCSGPALLASALASSFKPVTPVQIRFDKETPSIVTGSYNGSGDLMRLDVVNLPAFHETIGKAQRMALRIDDKIGTDVSFELGADNRIAFMAAAAATGVDAGQAGIAFDMLGETLSRAAAGQYATAVELLTVMKIDWRRDGRPRDTGLVMWQVTAAFANTTNARVIEDAGQVLFGAMWTAVRPMVVAKGDKAYRMLNQSVAAQLAWLKDNCPK